MKPEETYLQNLRTIERIASFVARRSHLNADESAEFVQEVRFRLLEDDYAIIRKFEGRSQFSTYLTIVIGRLGQQWRVEQWGKWRPSAEARRLGDTAITLERLISRDGFSFAEAVRILTTPAGSKVTAAQLEALYLRLPLRNPRPVLISDDAFPQSLPADTQSDDAVESRDRERSARAAARTMDEVLGTFDPEDRLILQMRFWDAQKVPDIARVLHLEQKKVYKRLDKLFAALRRGLERAGVTKADVGRLLTRGDQEIRVKALAGPGIGAASHSHNSGGKDVRSREGGLP